MNAKLVTLASLFLVAAEASGGAPVANAGETQSLPHIQAVQHVFDCQARALPSQREVGEWTGQHNFAQVYETRRKLMAEVARACLRDGIEQVQLVQDRSPDASAGREVARVEIPRR